MRGRAVKLHIGGTGCEKQEPEKLRMPVQPNCPIIFPAAHRDRFTMQETRLHNSIAITLKSEGRNGFHGYFAGPGETKHWAVRLR